MGLLLPKANWAEARESLTIADNPAFDGETSL